jgi:hypothetical protein
MTTTWTIAIDWDRDGDFTDTQPHSNVGGLPNRRIACS